MRSLVRWVYLNLEYRLRPLPTDPVILKKIAIDLNVSLAFTYKWHGLDVALAQERIHECLNSFRWIGPRRFSRGVRSFNNQCYHFRCRPVCEIRDWLIARDCSSMENKSTSSGGSGVSTQTYLTGRLT